MKPLTSQLDITQIISLLAGCINISIKKSNVIESVSALVPNRPNCFDEKEYILSSIKSFTRTNINYFHTKHNESFISVKVSERDMFVVGPLLLTRMTDTRINTIIEEKNLPLLYRKEIVDYYKSLTYIDLMQYHNLGALLHYLLFGEEPPDIDETVINELKSSFQKTMTVNLDIGFSHHSYQHDIQLFKYVKEGEVEKVKTFLTLPLDGEIGITSPNIVRNYKNIFIMVTAELTHATLEAGLDSEESYTLSDTYVQKVEKLSNPENIYNLYKSMCIDFTSRINSFKKSNLSKPIYKVQKYVKRNLTKKITLTELANTANLTESYLSRLFLSEVGINISAYIQKVRVDEAKNLLNYTNHSVMDIALFTGFKDQSYFTKVFKKHTGITPAKYKHKNKPSLKSTPKKLTQ